MNHLSLHYSSLSDLVTQDFFRSMKWKLWTNPPQWNSKTIASLTPRCLGLSNHLTLGIWHHVVARKGDREQNVCFTFPKFPLFPCHFCPTFTHLWVTSLIGSVHLSTLSWFRSYMDFWKIHFFRMNFIILMKKISIYP